MIVKPIDGRRGRDRFIDVPFHLYPPGSPWVPPVRASLSGLLNPQKNPFFKVVRHQLLVAEDRGSLVGRIGVFMDPRFEAAEGRRVGSFGFFESVDSQEVAFALFEEGARWLGAQGAEVMRGPFNPSANHESGFLASHFDQSPVVGMTYTPEHYLSLCEAWGFTQVRELLTYEFDRSTMLPDRMLRHSARLRETEGITFRHADFRHFDRDVGLILEIYNDAWEDLWGFLPWAPGEFEFLAADLKLLLDPELILYAEVKGEIAGFGLAVSDLNQIFRRIPSGRLFPTGLSKILWYGKGPTRRKTVTQARIMALGVKKRFQALGLGPLFYEEYMHKLKDMGFQRCEVGWVLEDNHMMNRGLRLMGAKPVKRYRILEKTLA
jgi:hypothetical protein